MVCSQFKGNEKSIEILFSDMEAYFLSILELENLGAIEKLKLMLRRFIKKKIISSSVLEIMHKSELPEKSNITVIKVIPPIIVKLIEQGKNEGVFSNIPTVELVQVVLAGYEFILDSDLFHWSSQKRTLFLKEIQKLFELMVGVKAGTLDLISMEY